MAHSETANWIKQPSTAIICNWLNKNMPISFGSYKISDLYKTGLVIVDAVNGFCTPGAGKLAPISPDPIISRAVNGINLLANKFASRKMEILLFEDCHDPNTPEAPYSPHCLKGSGEEKLVDELGWLYRYNFARHIPKDCLNGFIGAESFGAPNEFLRWLRGYNIEDLIICGFVTDLCVLDLVDVATSLVNHAGLALGLKNVIVYESGCATFEAPNHPREIMHHIGLYQMVARGAILSDKISFPN